MLIFVVLAVFLAGLMVGRTPEYLGKKIQSDEVKMSLLVLAFSILYASRLRAAKDLSCCRCFALVRESCLRDLEGVRFKTTV